jgi:hypothetical protein
MAVFITNLSSGLTQKLQVLMIFTHLVKFYIFFSLFEFFINPNLSDDGILISFVFYISHFYL